MNIVEQNHTYEYVFTYSIFSSLICPVANDFVFFLPCQCFNIGLRNSLLEISTVNYKLHMIEKNTNKYIALKF